MNCDDAVQNEASRPAKRSVRFEYPLAMLFAVTHDLLLLDLQLGGE